WTVPVAEGAFVAHADYSHQSRKFFFPVQSARQSGYGILNARLSYMLDSPEIEFSLWGRNLAGKKYSSYILDFYASAGVVPAFPGPDRSYGAAISYNF